MTTSHQPSRTALSRSLRSKRRDRGHLWAVARRSHCNRVVLALSTLGTLSATSCIVADAPEYGSPQRSPIFMFEPVPTNPASVQLLTRDMEPKAFGATIRSEDAGEQIVATFFIDYKHAGERLLATYVLQPYTLEQERKIQRYVTPSREFSTINTCHTITLLVTHYTSWDQENTRFVGPTEDLASVTWFVSYEDDGSTVVSKCPSAANEIP